MNIVSRTFVGLMALLFAMSTGSPARAATFTREEQQAIVQEAYIYLYPLVTMDVTRKQFINTSATAGSFGGPANAFLNLVSDAAEFGTPLGIGGVTQPDGTFTIPDVPPGRYVLNASLRGDGPSEAGSVPLTVLNDDVTGNTIVTGRPATLKGRFVAEAGVAGPLPEALLVAAAARPGGTVLASGSGSFELDDLTEPFTLRVEYLPDGWGVKSIVVDGADVTDAKVDLAATHEAEAQIVLTKRLTRITGTVSRC